MTADPRGTATLLGPGSPLLTGRSGRGVTVAVIDSGVNPWHAHVGGLAGGVAFSDMGVPHDDLLDRLGHGTAIAAAIHEKAPAAEIRVVKVFDTTLSTSFDAIVCALRWAIARRIRLVNLSLGTVNPEREAVFGELVEEARAAGTMLVSARRQGERDSYPGSLAGVVAVEVEAGIAREAASMRCLGDRIHMSASAFARPIPGVPVERNLNGTSFAVANATGLLARLLEGEHAVGTVEELSRLLRSPAAPPAQTAVAGG